MFQQSRTEIDAWKSFYETSFRWARPGLNVWWLCVIFILNQTVKFMLHFAAQNCSGGLSIQVKAVLAFWGWEHSKLKPLVELSNFERFRKIPTRHFCNCKYLMMLVYSINRLKCFYELRLFLSSIPVWLKICIFEESYLKIWNMSNIIILTFMHWSLNIIELLTFSCHQLMMRDFTLTEIHLLFS